MSVGGTVIRDLAGLDLLGGPVTRPALAGSGWGVGALLRGVPGLLHVISSTVAAQTPKGTKEEP